jgi:hypothetical protein
MKIEIRVALLYVPRFPTDYVIEIEEDEYKQKDLGRWRGALSFCSVPGVDTGLFCSFRT